MDRDRFEEKYSEGRQEEAQLREILAIYTIDSALSTEEILRCSKAVSLLSGSPKGSLLHDSDIFIYSFPRINQYILLRIIEKEATLESADKEIPILTKLDNLFFIKNSKLEFYFQIFEEDSTLAKQYLEALKLV